MKNECEITSGKVDLTYYQSVDGTWRELGLAAPARRALVNANCLSITDLKKFTEAEISALHGMGPNALAKLRAVAIFRKAKK